MAPHCSQLVIVILEFLVTVNLVTESGELEQLALSRVIVTAT